MFTQPVTRVVLSAELYCYQIDALVAKKSYWLLWDVTDVVFPSIEMSKHCLWAVSQIENVIYVYVFLCQVIVLNHKTHRIQAVSPFELRL